MSTKSYQLLCDEYEADQRLRERIADEKLGRFAEPIEIVSPVLTPLGKFYEAVIGCRNMTEAVKISPDIVAGALELKTTIPYDLFPSVRAICECWHARMTWSELALEIGQVQRAKRREQLLAQEKSKS